MDAALFWPKYNTAHLDTNVPWVVLHPMQDMLDRSILDGHFQDFLADEGGVISDYGWEERFLDYLIERGYWIPWIVTAYEVPVSDVPHEEGD